MLYKKIRTAITVLIKKERSGWLTGSYQPANEKSKSIQIGESGIFIIRFET